MKQKPAPPPWATELSASDVMQRDVIVTRQGDTLREALALMTENHVTGLPVMNRQSRCVGVITATDILNFEQDQTQFDPETEVDLALHYDPDTGQWESLRGNVYALENFGETLVDEVMSREIIAVAPQAPLVDVAEKLLKQRVHRVLVLDEDLHLFGIISTTDFVRLFA